MQDQGWIKVFRKLLDKPIWLQSTPEQKTILITLLLMANHKEQEWEWKSNKFKTCPGQFITSLDSIVKKCGKGISIQNVRSALERFKKLEFLTNESTKTGRLITIVNWGLYQDENKESNKGVNKEVTKTQQRGNKEVTPNKNDKNERMKEDIYINLNFIDDFIDKVKITQEHYDKLISKFGKDNVFNNIRALDNYITNGKGNKYKDHYKVLSVWCNKHKEDKPANETPVRKLKEI